MVAKFEGRKNRAGREDGWARALMEMLVDPLLASWVPAWVVEQYDRWNPHFRAVLRENGVRGTRRRRLRGARAMAVRSVRRSLLTKIRTVTTTMHRGWR